MEGLRRIVMLGPAHYVAFSGLALPGVDQMETPLGGVVIDVDGVASLRTNPLVLPLPEAHEREHSLEVQLPFLQIVAPGVSVLPLLTGDIDPTVVANVVEPLLGEGTLLLVSSDLSHFHDADTARHLDAAAASAIEQLDPGALDRDSACGRVGIQAALHLARRNGFTVETLDLRNSSDTAGSADRVVGYGTFAIG
jgi:AmmeMemoRadiSam system protein B